MMKPWKLEWIHFKWNFPVRPDVVSVETSKAFSITRLLLGVWKWIGWIFVESQPCMTVT